MVMVMVIVMIPKDGAARVLVVVTLVVLVVARGFEWG